MEEKMATKGNKVAFVVQSKVKELIKKSKMKCSSDVILAVNHIVQWHVEKGCTRAKANGRKTLRAADL
jgi:hypothetical protein